PLHRRQHVSRSHRAHPHPRRQLQRHRPRQLNHSRLGRVVVRVIRISHHPISRRRLQNHSRTGRNRGRLTRGRLTRRTLTREPFPHVPRRRLRHIKHACQIHRQHPLPLLRSDVQKPVPNADPRIVDHHIHAIHQPNRLRKRRLHLHQISHVGNDCRSKASRS